MRAHSKILGLAFIVRTQYPNLQTSDAERLFKSSKFATKLTAYCCNGDCESFNEPTDMLQRLQDLKGKDSREKKKLNTVSEWRILGLSKCSGAQLRAGFSLPKLVGLALRKPPG